MLLIQGYCCKYCSYVLLGQADEISVVCLRNLNSHRYQSLTLANLDYTTAFIFNTNTVAVRSIFVQLILQSIYLFVQYKFM